MTVDTVEARYQRDPHFHALVDSMYHAIVKLQLTPTEIREAAMLASIKAEVHHPRPFILSNELRQEMLERGVPAPPCCPDHFRRKYP